MNYMKCDIIHGYLCWEGLKEKSSSSLPLVSRSITWGGLVSVSSSSWWSTLTIKLVVDDTGDKVSVSVSELSLSSKLVPRVEWPVVLWRCSVRPEEAATLDRVELPPRVTVGDLDPLPPCFFFTALRQFIRALDVCSSKMDFFMLEPICIHVHHSQLKLSLVHSEMDFYTLNLFPNFCLFVIFVIERSRTVWRNWGCSQRCTWVTRA